MMTEVSAYQAKTHFSELLNKVQKGEYIRITKHNTLVALLVPAEEMPQNLKEVHAALKKFRKGKNLKGISIRAMIEEGRR